MSDMIEVMREHGVYYDGMIIPDGKIHRFPTDNKRKNNGWYRCFGDYGAFGDWGKGLSVKWHNSGTNSVDNVQIQRNIKAARARQEQNYLAIANKAQIRFDAASCKGESDYLERKQAQPFGVRFERQTLLVPLRDIDGKIWSLQLISDSGKWFMSGGKVRGCFHVIGEIEPNGHVYIAEGYATAASIQMATGATVIVAFNVGNLKHTISTLSNFYPNLFITIAADNDQWKDCNIGRDTAYQLSGEFGCNVVVPYFTILDGNPTDFNDLHVIEGIESVAEQLEVHYV